MRHMAKSRTQEEDKEALHKKVQEKQAHSENPEGDETIRSLRKRLKRVQRRIRGLKAREQRSAPKKAAYWSLIQEYRFHTQIPMKRTYSA